jgi:hypothetical protein
VIKLLGKTADDVANATLASGGNLPVAMYDTATAMSDASGRFTILGVPPGEYTIKQGRMILYPAVAEGTGYWVAQPITVGTTSVDDVVVELKPAIKVRGRIQFLETMNPASAPVFLVRGTGAVTFRTPNGQPGRFSTEMQQPDGPFTFGTVGAAGGRYVAEPNETSGWFVESVTLEGKDITDRVFDLQSDITSMVVTYTNRPSRVSGSVKNARGAADADALVAIFPVDETRWRDYGAEPRLIRSIGPSATGEFAFAHLPPGDYFIAAIDDEDAQMWRDPAHLKALTAQATRVTVVAHTPLTVNLTSVKAPR